MISQEYDEYMQYIMNSSDEELELETDDAFTQINDADESIKYALCVEEHNLRLRKHYNHGGV
jgi:hypothetical protein